MSRENPKRMVTAFGGSPIVGDPRRQNPECSPEEDYPPPETDVRQVQEQINVLTRIVNDNSQLVIQLRSRLVSLVVSDPEGCDGEDGRPWPPLCPLAHEIMTVGNAVALANGELKWLLDRIQI